MYKEACPTDDIKVIKDVYPIMARQFGKSLNTVAINIEIYSAYGYRYGNGR